MFVDVIVNLDHYKAHSPDNSPACLLKESAVQIAPSLCSLFNKSLRIGVVPDNWKLANIVPVYKRGEKAEVENYRPISLLSLGMGSFLTNQYQQTTILRAMSRPLPVTSGVPQGTILGRLLFLLYENRLSNTLTNSRIATFADDTTIFKTINSISDASALQNDLSNFQESSSSINLELNNTRCKVLK
ncbi:Hypothetical predicted protein, partial [Paramuricea clavata]